MPCYIVTMMYQRGERGRHLPLVGALLSDVLGDGTDVKGKEESDNESDGCEDGGSNEKVLGLNGGFHY